MRGAQETEVLCEESSKTIRIDHRRSYAFGLGWEPGRRADLQIDLLRLAAAVFLTDRAFSRGLHLGRWVRSFSMDLPVHEPRAWRKALPALVQVLSFLSGDNWSIGVRPVRDRGSPTRDRELRARGAPAAVALFSGGLDSFCGAAHLMHDLRPGQVAFFLASYVSGRERLQALLDPIAAKSQGLGYLNPVRFTFSRGLARQVGRKELPERSRRTRSFFYLMQAVASALQFSIPRVRIYENGIIALNFPQTPDCSGTRATNHAHPYYLECLNRFLSALLESDAPWVENPFEHSTKTEILAHATEHRRQVHRTATCWAYPNGTASLGRQVGRPEVTHCGWCYPCLVRRVSLRRAGWPDPKAIYADDVFAAARRGFPDPVRWRRARDLIDFAQRLVRMPAQEMLAAFGARLLQLSELPTLSPLRDIHRMHVRFGHEVLDAMAG